MREGVRKADGDETLFGAVADSYANSMEDAVGPEAKLPASRGLLMRWVANITATTVSRERALERRIEALEAKLASAGEVKP